MDPLKGSILYNVRILESTTAGSILSYAILYHTIVHGPELGVPFFWILPGLSVDG